MQLFQRSLRLTAKYRMIPSFRRICFICLIAQCALLSRASALVSTDSTKVRPSITAFRLSGPISIDGRLTEHDWQRPGITQFTQHDPNEGQQPTQKTEVWVAYDDAALYVAARLYDTHPDSIVNRIGRRDADITADAFYVGIDSYHDRRTGVYFTVTAGGSVGDGTLYNDEWSDGSWDGVWETATSIDGQGWSVEIRIPFSQLRFPALQEYVWGINFTRQIERNQERDDFVMVPKKESGWVSRFADLSGLRDIHPPPRYEFLPYFGSSAKYTQHLAGDPFNNGHVYLPNGGLDFKLGVGNNFTVNGTVNPDFGQVEVDPAVVNLTQYETYFDEKRPFFIEGSNFFDFGFGGANNNWGFNWGTPTFFYSRRVGRPPEGAVQHEGFTDIPDRTHILGAAKMTGKPADGWSIAALQAFTAREYGKVDSSGVRFADEVEPFTSYGVVRGLREFNAGRQAIGFIGTATLRNLDRGYVADAFNRQSYAFAVDGWTNLDPAQTWVLNGWLASTQVNGTTGRITSLQEDPLHYYQRPDAPYVRFDTNARSLSGYGGRVALNKQKGNTFLNAAFGFISPGFDVSDLGFLYHTNVYNGHVVLGYNWFDPDGFFRRKSLDVATFRNYDFGGNITGQGYFLLYNMTLMNYWTANGNISMSPAVYDPTKTRGGPLMRNTTSYSVNISGSTDTRNALAFLYGFLGERSESGGYQTVYDPGVQWRPTPGLSFTFTPEFNHNVTIAQWVMKQDDPTATATFGSRYLFAKLDQHELSASVRLDWTFSPKLTLQVYIQPLISVGSYSEFKELKQPGTYTFNRYGIDNGSTITRASRDYWTALDPSHPSDTTLIAAGDYVADADGPGPAQPYRVANPDFNFKSLRGNAVLRWEFLPGSTIYLAWTQQRVNGDDAGEFSFGRDFHDLLLAPGDNVFLLKVAYWWNPQ